MEWCDGRPLVERRPLTAEERERFASERQRYRWRACLTIPGLLLAFVLLWTIASLVKANPGLSDGIMAVGMILLISLGIPLAILLTRDANRRSRQLWEDLRADCVVRYADDTTSFEALPVSRRLLTSQRWATVGPAITVADTPDAAPISALPDDECDEWAVPLTQRILSQAERDEIRRYAHNLWRRPMWPAIFMTLWASLPLLGLIHILLTGEKPNITWESAILFFFVFCGALVRDIAFATAIRTARKLGQDIARGIVEVREEIRGSDQVIVEWLPIADFGWTIDGKPDEWRTMPVG